MTSKVSEAGAGLASHQAAMERTRRLRPRHTSEVSLCGFGNGQAVQEWQQRTHWSWSRVGFHRVVWLVADWGCFAVGWVVPQPQAVEKDEYRVPATSACK